MVSENSAIDLSIIVVSFNTLEMTRECLSSVFEHLGKLNAQVIVVDNNSKDGSVEMIRDHYPRVTLVVNSENKGFAAANNQGFRLASGQYVLLLNSDTIVLGNVLERTVEYLQYHNNVGAMGCRILNTDLSMQPTCSGYPTLSRLLFMTLGLDKLSERFDSYTLRHWKRDTEREVEVISGCYMMVRQEIIQKIRGLDEDFFFFGEETEWCLRIRRAGWKLMFAPVGEVVHHGGGAVKKLKYRRDLMLTEATIRLHKKEAGLMAALLAFLILGIFNWSRAIIWTIASIASTDYSAKAKHFQQVAVQMFTTWPEDVH